MLLFGHRFIKSPSFYHISNIDAITSTPPSSTIFLEFSEANLDIIHHANLNHIPMALSVQNIEELIYASSLNANYMIIDKEMAKTAHDIAQNYLFDAKVLVKISEDEEIEEIAILGVDGVIYSSAIIKVV